MANKKFFEKPNKQFKELFDQRVKTSKSIVITSHLSPDDDAISSVLSLYAYLTEFLKIKSSSVRMIITGKENPRWGYFENYEKIQYKEDLTDEMKGVDTLIMVDGSGWYRFTNKEDELKTFSCYTICIDHHPNPEDKHNLHLLDANFVSCAEIIYKLFFEDEKIGSRLAENIFLGIWGDTGGLRFVRPDNTSAFETIRAVVDAGNINIQTLESKYMKYDFGVFKIISALMEKTTIESVDGWPPAQVSYLPRSFSFGITTKPQSAPSNILMYCERYIWYAEETSVYICLSTISLGK